MANVSVFDVKTTGDDRILNDLKQCVSLGIDEWPEGANYWGRHILRITRLFADIDPEHEHSWVGLGLEQEHAILGPSFRDPDTRLACLYLEGSAPDVPPYKLVRRLARKYPDLTFRLWATTDDNIDEIWEITNDSADIVRLSFSPGTLNDYHVHFVRDGKLLDVPEIEDETLVHSYGSDYQPFVVTPQPLFELCEDVYREFGRDWPEAEFRKVVCVFLRSRSERFEVQPDIDWDEEPSEQVRQMAEEIEARIQADFPRFVLEWADDVRKLQQNSGKDQCGEKHT